MSEIPWLNLFKVRLHVRAAWLGAVAATILNMVGNLLQRQMLLKMPGILIWHSELSAAVGFLLFVLLIWQRKKVTVPIASAAYLLNALAIIVTLAADYPVFTIQPERWVPFQASKLACLVAAILAPSFPVGALAIAGHAGSALWIYWALPPEIRERLAFGEPWAMIIFGFAGALILTLRFGQVAVMQSISAANSEASSARVLASGLLRFRDLMNTPLQTLDLGIAILSEGQKTKTVPDPELFERMLRAVESLRDINEQINKYEKNMKLTTAYPPKPNSR